MGTRNTGAWNILFSAGFFPVSSKKVSFRFLSPGPLIFSLALTPLLHRWNSNLIEIDKKTKRKGTLLIVEKKKVN